VHRFLVKGGEDLRLDERIQQAFGIVNGFLARDRVCSARRLRIVTYRVIPLSSRAGLIQWVDGTRPFKELIEEEWANRRSLASPQPLAKEAPAVVRSSWIQRITGDAVYAGHVKTESERFLLLYDQVTRSDAAAELEEEQRCIPQDLMRGALMSLSTTPEAFLFLRSEFAKSLSVFNTVSYVLGIGDRHLDNFLLSVPSGRMVGIDFGHAFGSATQVLPIPEIVPFRMTRQLVSAIQPHGVEGVYKLQMAHTLEALRQNRELLLNALDVFVKEPIMSWDANIARLLGTKAAKLGAASDKEARRWYPLKRLAVVGRKLSLGNPGHITAQELRESVHRHNRLLDKMVEVALGDREHNVRARVREVCSSVMEQVDCLLDQATDPNVLAKTYSGWLPWA
jgi:DNA-dependent protein kinase catalytic subunit